jgi:hypothetical protein
MRLMNSIFLRLPVISIGLFMSYWAATAWCASAGPAASTNPIAAANPHHWFFMD